MIFTWCSNYQPEPVTEVIGDGVSSITDWGRRFQIITDRVAYRENAKIATNFVKLHHRLPHIGGGAEWFLRRSRWTPLFWLWWKLNDNLERYEQWLVAQLWVIRGMCECASEHPNGRHWLDPLSWRALWGGRKVV